MKDLPALPYREWSDTLETLHRWSQIVGKVQLELTPLVNHWWNVPLLVSSRGLTTRAIVVDDRSFEMELDFVAGLLRIKPSDGPERFVELRPRTVADFYAATMAALHEAGIDVRIWTMPVEIDNPIRFEVDDVHRAYDREYVLRFWRCLTRIESVLERFRTRFIGKASPVHFFWGSFDLAVSLFSGRRAPAVTGNRVDREAYSHEVFSAGWWAGDPRFERAAFYSYASPASPQLALADVEPPEAYYMAALHCFVLDHDDVRRADDPGAAVMEFFETTYDAAAELGAWPRADLERGRSEEDHAVLTSGEPRGRATPDDRL